MTGNNQEVQRNNQQSTKRRNVLATLAGGAVSGTLISPVGAKKGNDYVEIVTDVHDGEPISKETVPAKWYRGVLNSRRVQENLVQRYSGHPAVKAVGRPAGKNKVEDLNIPRVQLQVKKTKDSPPEIPSQVEGVQVETTEWERPSTEACNDTTYDCVPGGCLLDTENTQGDFDAHSGACDIVYDGNPAYLTCAHGMGECGDDITGQVVKSGADPGKKIGEVVDYNWRGDWAVVDVTWDNEISGLANAIIDSYTTYGVSGHVTQDGLDYLASSEETVYQYGMMSCESSGKVNDPSLWYSYCEGDMVKFVSTTCDTESGDSGGVHYRNLGFGETIIGVHHGGDDGWSWASQAHYINANNPIEFGLGNPSC